jgi:hypothetical protein
VDNILIQVLVLRIFPLSHLGMLMSFLYTPCNQNGNHLKKNNTVCTTPYIFLAQCFIKHKDNFTSAVLRARSFLSKMKYVLCRSYTGPTWTKIKFTSLSGSIIKFNQNTFSLKPKCVVRYTTSLHALSKKKTQKYATTMANYSSSSKLINKTDLILL